MNPLQAVWLKLGSTIGIGIVLAVWILTPSGTERHDPELEATAERQELVARLHEIRRAWRPEERTRLIEALAADLEPRGLVPPLRYTLAGPTILVDQALEVARVARATAAVPELRAILADGPAARRGPALRALHACGALHVDEVVGCLRGDDTGLQIAALQVARGFDDFPWPVLIERLGADHEEVRAAAVDAFPSLLPTRAIGRLVDMIVRPRSDEPQAAAAATRVLADRPIGAAAETEIAEILAGRGAFVDATARCRLLTVLASKSAVLTHAADSVWALAIDDTAGDLVRANAWHCLACTRTEAPVGEEEAFLVDDLALRDPLVCLLAGRYLVRNGRVADGAKLLLTACDDPRVGVARAARRAFGALSGMSPNAERSQLERWLFLHAEEADRGSEPVLPPIDAELLLPARDA